MVSPASVPTVYCDDTDPRAVRETIRARLPAGYVGPFELRVRYRSTCKTCGPQEYSKSERYAVCPACGGPTDPRPQEQNADAAATI